MATMTAGNVSYMGDAYTSDPNAVANYSTGALGAPVAGATGSTSHALALLLLADLALLWLLGYAFRGKVA